MKKENKATRRDFIKRSLLALTLPVAISAKASNKKPGVKMLTPDGKLVEVPSDAIKNSSRKKATNKEIQHWINKEHP